MNKIPELTQEHKDLIQCFAIGDNIPDGMIDKSFAQSENIFLQCLKVADEQGLLTKEASLALKPDNYIEWTENVGDCPKYDGKNNQNLGIGIYRRGKRYEILILAGIRFILKGVYFECVQECKDHCQTWLNNYIKEQG